MLIAIVTKNGTVEAISFAGEDDFLTYARREWETDSRAIESVADAKTASSADNTSFTLLSEQDALADMQDARIDYLVRRALQRELGNSSEAAND